MSGVKPDPTASQTVMQFVTPHSACLKLINYKLFRA